MKLTGRTRHRLHKTMFGKPLLVLQLEVSYTAAENCGGWIETETRTTWRDAQVEDYQYIKGIVE